MTNTGNRNNNKHIEMLEVKNKKIRKTNNNKPFQISIVANKVTHLNETQIENKGNKDQD